MFKIKDTTLVKYTGYGKEVVIPAQITCIGKSAFAGNRRLETVIMEDGVNLIEADAFRNCEALKTIEIPKSVRKIEQRAFEGCESLINVNIEEGVEIMNWGVFHNCDSLEQVVLPGSIKSIGPATFYECGSLKSVVIGEGTSSISEKAFYGCGSLEHIVLPSSLAYIDEKAFTFCESLKSVSLPEGVRAIGPTAFFGCTKLEKITAPKSGIKIGENAFGKCKCSGISINDSTEYVQNMGDLSIDLDVKNMDIVEMDEAQQLPFINTQFNQLVNLENNVHKAVNLAEKAKKKAKDAQIHVGLFKKREAIELLQDAAKGLADAQMSAADAQKLSFEYQTKLTEICMNLFMMGTSNLAMNRSVVRELELKLKGAEEEELSDLAQQELKNVIQQLKAQEDMMKKHEALMRKTKELEMRVNEIDSHLEDVDAINVLHDENINKNTEKLRQYSKVLSEQYQINADFERKIKEIEEVQTQHGEKCVENSTQIELINQRIDKIDISKMDAWRIAVSVVAGLSLLLNVLQIFNVV